MVTFDGSVEKMGNDNEHRLVEDRVVLRRPGNAFALEANVRANVSVRGKQISRKTADFLRQGFVGSMSGTFVGSAAFSCGSRGRWETPEPN